MVMVSYIFLLSFRVSPALVIKSEGSSNVTPYHHDELRVRVNSAGIHNRTNEENDKGMYFGCHASPSLSLYDISSFDQVIVQLRRFILSQTIEQGRKRSNSLNIRCSIGPSMPLSVSQSIRIIK